MPAAVLHEFGPASNLRCETVDDPRPAADAQAALENRQTVGKVVLIP